MLFDDLAHVSLRLLGGQVGFDAPARVSACLVLLEGPVEFDDLACVSACLLLLLEASVEFDVRVGQ